MGDRVGQRVAKFVKISFGCMRGFKTSRLSLFSFGPFNCVISAWCSHIKANCHVALTNVTHNCDTSFCAVFFKAIPRQTETSDSRLFCISLVASERRNSPCAYCRNQPMKFEDVLNAPQLIYQPEVELIWRTDWQRTECVSMKVWTTGSFTTGFVCCNLSSGSPLRDLFRKCFQCYWCGTKSSSGAKNIFQSLSEVNMRLQGSELITSSANVCFFVKRKPNYSHSAVDMVPHFHLKNNTSLEFGEFRSGLWVAEPRGWAQLQHLKVWMLSKKDRMKKNK